MYWWFSIGLVTAAMLLGCGSDDVAGSTGTGGAGGSPSGSSSTGGSGGSGGGAFTLEVNWEPCPLITGDDIDASAECADIEVPLDWDDPSGRRIELFLKRYVAGDGGPSERQLWNLAGGPGQPSVGFEGLVDQVKNVAPNMTFYLLDHRGVGRSTRLGCPDQEALSSEGAQQITAAEMPACLAAVGTQFSDAELAGFSTTMAARDVGALVDHLRGPDEQVVIWGGSYGTHWANRYAQIHPDQADAILLGALAVGGELATIDGRFDSLARRYLDLCDADVCATTIGALFNQPAKDLAETTLAGAGATLCPAISALGWDAELLKIIFGQFLYDHQARKLIPPLVYRAARCSPDDVEVFTALATAFSGSPTSLTPAQELWGMFITHHVIKSELWTDPPITEPELQAIVDGAIAINGTSSLLIQSYDEWPRYAAPPDELATPSARVMMVHGDLDFTPASLYQPVADHYLALSGDNFFRLLPGATHGLASPTAMGPHCGPSMMWAFASNPDAQPADCTPDVLPLDFTVPPNLAQSLLGTTDPWEGGTTNPATAPPVSPLVQQLRERFWRVAPTRAQALGGL